MRRIEITADIRSKLERAVGEINMDKISIFETYAVDTLLPFDKPGSIFNGGFMSESTLKAMVEHVNSPSPVPILIAHNEFTVPTGSLFYAEARPSGEGLGFYGLFYVLKDSEAGEKLETGIIDSVSVGVRSEQLKCSVCGFDYYGEDSTFENFYSQTCANGHTVGVDGTHVVMEGLKRFYEVSLVANGAHTAAKILPAEKQVIGKRQLAMSFPLAASSCIPHAAFLVSQTKERERKMADENKKPAAEGATLSAAQLVNDFAELKASHLILSKESEGLKKENEALKAQVESLKALEKDKADIEATKASAAKAEAVAKKAVEFLAAEAKKAVVAANISDAEIGEDVEGLCATIEKCRQHLVHLMPVGGVSEGTKKEAKVDTRGFGAFKA